MKYYSAVVNEDEIHATTIFPPYNILASYHYFKSKPELIKKSIAMNHSVFIDSGAFSAHNSGKEIDIDDFCKFIKETGAIHYASLDVMGDAKATIENYNYMVEKHGLKPILTFHMGSSIEELHTVLDVDCKYIALGGLVFSSGIMNHCDEVWSVILNRKPHLKVHGFGLTNIELMKRYPWYSVDSSSFKSCKRFGRQNIIWDNFDFKTFSEEEYLELLEKIGFEFPETEDKEQKTALNKKKWLLYDFHSSQSYKMYASHLTELNKIKDFSYLTTQQKLF